MADFELEPANRPVCQGEKDAYPQKKQASAFRVVRINSEHQQPKTPDYSH